LYVPLAIASRTASNLPARESSIIRFRRSASRALSDNDTATEFYRALGGRMVARSSEKFGPKSLDKVAFAWTN